MVAAADLPRVVQAWAVLSSLEDTVEEARQDAAVCAQFDIMDLLSVVSPVRRPPLSAQPGAGATSPPPHRYATGLSAGSLQAPAAASPQLQQFQQDAAGVAPAASMQPVHLSQQSQQQAAQQAAQQAQAQQPQGSSLLATAVSPSAAAAAAAAAAASTYQARRRGEDRNSSTFSDWTLKADERRARFQKAREEGKGYNKGVILQVHMCKGPNEGGTTLFPMGRGKPLNTRPVIPCANW